MGWGWGDRHACREPVGGQCRLPPLDAGRAWSSRFRGQKLPGPRKAKEIRASLQVLASVFKLTKRTCTQHAAAHSGLPGTPFKQLVCGKPPHPTPPKL